MKYEQAVMAESPHMFQIISVLPKKTIIIRATIKIVFTDKETMLSFLYLRKKIKILLSLKFLLLLIHISFH